MAGSLDWAGTTNNIENSCKSVNCDCTTVWEYYQQMAMSLLSNKKDNQNYRIEPGYEARARRIASIYARIYLEMFPFTTNQSLTASTYSGRFYWMGLGAFASKTVAAVFDHIVSKTGSNADALIKSISSDHFNLDRVGVAGIHTFAKGNLWLYMDISVWHFVWAKSSADFKICVNNRDTTTYKKVKSSLYNFPWSNCLTTVNNLQATDEIRNAFRILPDIEKIFEANTNKNNKFKKASNLLLEHLLQIANQEQINILQKIVWNDPIVKNGADVQRKAGIPKAELILSSEYDGTIKKIHAVRGNVYSYETEFGKKIKSLPESPISTPPSGTKVENQDSRMRWINLAAQKYHRLMLSEVGRPYLEKELRTIADWNTSKWDDGLSQFDKLFIKIGKESNDGKGG
ncbi:hypothetical protein MWMV8_MWMV8_01117 [Acinetobacter calcoaceticus]|jgi:hypothetical protein|nr:hypothetical protein MWMV8_MWMV8_01117 [Acinetobacter calcoaceticus]